MYLIHVSADFSGVHGFEGETLEISSLIESVASNLLRLAVIELPQDVKQALNQAYQKETNPRGKVQLQAVLDNIRLAEEMRRPLCQDTGFINFYLKVYPQFPHLEKIEDALRRAVKRATDEIPLRPNAVDPFTQENRGDNIGVYAPYVDWEIAEENYLEITAFPKGGGSENVSALAMMTPGERPEGIRRFVLETVMKAGGMPCPPTVLGIGIGGGADVAMRLAKMALLRPIDQPHKETRINRLEKDLLRAVNSTGIGPMGLGGDSTALAVKVAYAHRHPASYPVAVAFQCWAARRSTARIYSDCKVEYLTHNTS